MKLTVRGKTVPVVPNELVRFGEGEIAEDEPVEVSYATPCGTRTMKVRPKLTGQNAYAITQPATFVFEPVMREALADTGCTNREYLQHCE